LAGYNTPFINFYFEVEISNKSIELIRKNSDWLK
jgi:hypothetical protein